MPDLIVVLNGVPAGVITHVSGRPRFTYVDDYAADFEATPLSLSMPLAVARGYDHRVTAPWLANLLPDDANVRERLARDFGARADSATALLEHIGRDCAGAVQLVAPSEISDVVSRPGSLEPVTVTSGRFRDREVEYHHELSRAGTMAPCGLGRANR
ncbi:HipA N-terminal domain-containing protein [Nocardia callitridis]|uniref:HipA N-terminal subdomain 1 domain-containing protein n=1 Tax=Nocardia callitridis TaxID=648753 RepID=A0ABP9KRR1_9NOCA